MHSADATINQISTMQLWGAMRRRVFDVRGNPALKFGARLEAVQCTAQAWSH